MKKKQLFEDVKYDKYTGMITVFSRSKNPNPKGLRQKGQDFLHAKGISDGVLWTRHKIELEDGGSVTYFTFSSIMYNMKMLTKEVKL